MTQNPEFKILSSAYKAPPANVGFLVQEKSLFPWRGRNVTSTHKTLEAKHKGVGQVGTLPASRTRWRVGGAGSTGRWCGTRSPILSPPSRSIPFPSCTKSEDGTRINRDKALLETPSRYSPFIDERFDQMWRFFRRSRFHQHQSGNHKDATWESWNHCPPHAPVRRVKERRGTKATRWHLYLTNSKIIYIRIRTNSQKNYNLLFFYSKIYPFTFFFIKKILPLTFTSLINNTYSIMIIYARRPLLLSRCYPHPHLSRWH